MSSKVGGKERRCKRGEQKEGERKGLGKKRKKKAGGEAKRVR